MFLLVGLGNPGKQYKYTRHNLGFMILDQLANSLGVSFKKRKLFRIAETNYKDYKVVLLKPMTYMNLSGRAVAFVVNKYKIDFFHILVICDDINLPFGTLRVRSKGSDGGQKGLRSIISSLGTDDFPRLRIGIGDHFQDATNYVLSSFNKNEQRDLTLIINGAVDAVECFVHNDIKSTMSRFNRNLLDN